MKENETENKDEDSSSGCLIILSAFIPIFLSVVLILFQVFIWLKVGAWPEWPVRYAFVDREISLQEVYDKGINEKLSLDEVDKELKAAKYVLGITPPWFQYFSKDSWIVSPHSWYGFHKVINWFINESIPAWLFLFSILLFWIGINKI